jgi:hypothetical protein
MTDAALNSFSDRDILIQLLTKFENMEREFREFRSEMKDELESLKERVTELERISDRQRGFLSGVDWLRGALISLPPSAVAFFLGKTQ